MYLIITAIIIFTILGGMLAIRMRDKLHLVLGFSAGAILGVALFDLLPEAIELTKNSSDIYFVMLLVALGFSAMLIADRFLSLHGHNDDCENPLHKGNLKLSALILHSFFDGFSIGLAFKINETIGWAVAAAVLMHKLSDGIATAGLSLASDKSKSSTYKWILISSIAPVIGIVVAQFINPDNNTLGLLLAVFAGIFVYISTNDLIPESHHHHSVVWTTASTMLGLSLAAIMAMIVF